MSSDQIITSGGLTEIAGADLSASQYCGVVRNSSGQVVLASAGGHIDGVLYSCPTEQGMACTVMPLSAGRLLIRAGGSFTAGKNLKVDAAGKFVEANAASVALGESIARSKTASTGTGQIVEATGPANAPVSVSGVQTLTGAGVVDADTLATDWVATSDNASLDDGKYVGQMKWIRAATGTSGSNVLTPDTVSADAAGGTSPASLTYTDAGQASRWEWLADGWKLREIVQAGTAAVAAAGTINPMHARHSYAVDATDTVTLPDGYYPGQRHMGTVISGANTPISVTSGKFYDEDGSADGVTLTHNPAAAGDMSLLEWDGARYVLLNHINAAIAP